MYIIWNNKGTLEDVELLKDFGLRADPQESLAGDLAVHFLICEAIALLSVPVEEASPCQGHVGAVNDFLSSLGGADFEPAVNDSTEEGSRYQSTALNLKSRSNRSRQCFPYGQAYKRLRWRTFRA